MAISARSIRRTTPPAGRRPRSAAWSLPVLLLALTLGLAATLSLALGPIPAPFGLELPLEYAWPALAVALVLGLLRAQHRGLTRRLLQLDHDYAVLRRHTAGSAHDMRAPMVTVSSYLELLAAGDFGPLPAAAQRAAAQAGRASARARSLVEATLAASLAARQPCKEPAATVDLNAVLGDVVASLGADIARTHAELAVAPLPLVQGSEPSYYRIFENLVQNAVRYTKQDTPPRIEIAASASEYCVEITVRDHGRGISAADHERVFLDRARGAPDVANGLGIGLATVRELVAGVGGSVWIDPVVMDGTCVRVRLPVAVSPQATV